MVLSGSLLFPHYTFCTAQIVQFQRCSHCPDRMPENKQLWGERFASAHIQKKESTVAGKEQWQERGAVIHIHPPRSRLYSINALQGGSTSPQVSQPYKTMPPTEKKVFKRMNLPGTSHIQTILTLDMKTMWNLLHQEHYTHS